MNGNINLQPKRERWFFTEMNWLLVLCIILPVLFLVLLEVTRFLYLENIMSRSAERAAVMGIMLLGVTTFSTFVFSIMRRLQSAADERGKKLLVINDIGLELSAEHQLDDLLDFVVNAASNILNAAYGVIAIAQEDGNLETFHVSANGQTKRLLTPPEESGVIDLIIRDGRTLLIDDLANHRGIRGFHTDLPSMKSLVGVPIVCRGRVIGGLYVCNKHGGEPFDMTDLSTLTLLSAQTSVAVDNAQLYERLQMLSVLEERQRIAMELHDGAIQTLYALGLQLDSLVVQKNGDTDGRILIEGAELKVKDVVGGINEVIAQLRSHIFQLNSDDSSPRRLSTALQAEVVRLRAHGIPEVSLEMDENISSDVDSYLFNAERVVHEAVSNIIRHSQASCAILRVSADEELACISVEDNGCGAAATATSEKGSGEGQGLNNMRTRLDRLGGKLEIRAAENSGYQAIMTVPLVWEKTHDDRI